MVLGKGIIAVVWFAIAMSDGAEFVATSVWNMSRAQDEVRVACHCELRSGGIDRSSAVGVRAPMMMLGVCPVGVGIVRPRTTLVRLSVNAAWPGSHVPLAVVVVLAVTTQNEALTEGSLFYVNTLKAKTPRVSVRRIR